MSLDAWGDTDEDLVPPELTDEQIQALFGAWAYCDDLDKSTEFMLAFMADCADVDYEVAVDFVLETSPEARQAWYENNPDWKEEFS